MQQLSSYVKELRDKETRYRVLKPTPHLKTNTLTKLHYKNMLLLKISTVITLRSHVVWVIYK